MVRKMTIINYRTKVPLTTKERNMRESNQGMQKTCIRLGVIIIIVGIIGSIALAWINGVTIETNSYFGVSKERSVPLTCAWLLGGLFSTAIGAVIMFSLAEILERLEMLDSSSQQIEHRVNSIESKKSEAEEIKYNNAWKCPKCGSENII